MSIPRVKYRVPALYRDLREMRKNKSSRLLTVDDFRSTAESQLVMTLSVSELTSIYDWQDESAQLLVSSRLRKQPADSRRHFPSESNQSICPLNTCSKRIDHPLSSTKAVYQLLRQLPPAPSASVTYLSNQLRGRTKVFRLSDQIRLKTIILSQLGDSR